MAKEYIEREAAKAKQFLCYYLNGKLSVPVVSVSSLDAIPAADVVKVVRCKDCRYAYDSVGGWCCSHGICVDCVIREDFFCADGVRMEVDNG